MRKRTQQQRLSNNAYAIKISTIIIFLWHSVYQYVFVYQINHEENNIRINKSKWVFYFKILKRFNYTSEFNFKLGIKKYKFQKEAQS